MIKIQPCSKVNYLWESTCDQFNDFDNHASIMSFNIGEVIEWCIKNDI